MVEEESATTAAPTPLHLSLPKANRYIAPATFRPWLVNYTLRRRGGSTEDRSIATASFVIFWTICPPLNRSSIRIVGHFKDAVRSAGPRGIR